MVNHLKIFGNQPGGNNLKRKLLWKYFQSALGILLFSRCLLALNLNTYILSFVNAINFPLFEEHSSLKTLMMTCTVVIFSLVSECDIKMSPPVRHCSNRPIQKFVTKYTQGFETCPCILRLKHSNQGFIRLLIV